MEEVSTSANRLQALVKPPRTQEYVVHSHWSKSDPERCWLKWSEEGYKGRRLAFNGITIVVMTSSKCSGL